MMGGEKIVSSLLAGSALMRTLSGKPAFEKLSDLPPFSRVLTGSDGSSVVRVPREIEKHLVVIETGAKRALICYNPEHSVTLKPHMAMIRGRLIAERYHLDNAEVACRGAVIEQVVDAAAVRNGETRLTDGEGDVHSNAKELFDDWVQLAVEENATDIHVQVINNIAEVRLRVDGALELLRDGSAGIYTPIQAERALAWAYNNAAGKGSNSNSQFSAAENLYCMIEAREVGNKRVALRYQSVRGAAGVKAVCRLLNVDIDMPTLSYQQLGYAESQIELLDMASHTPSGFVIFAGVTGSGKTTTLKTFIETHPDTGHEAFYSIEDPVEYPLRGVHQIPIQRDLIDRAGSSAKYAEVVAALMRADPGCVLMGEIRDTATALAGQQIVETGHMACATVHAHLISGIVPRLTNSEIGMSRDVLTNPNMLSLLAYQALVPKLCPHCRIRGDAYPNQLSDSKHIKTVLSVLKSRFKLPANLFFFRSSQGCEHCKFRGTRGLSVVGEMLMPDRKWLSLIRDAKDYEAVVYYRSMSDKKLESPDMTGKTVFEHTLYKAITGLVDPRQCERFDSFNRFEWL
jgi:type II secretory ATPase GspE/PulE/Tfp pilus assembly ATPase PilB-like protein